jgi:very-short-patch-repair endonuclease
VTQVVHRDGTRTFARVDFLWPDLGVVVEVSGRRGHASDAERACDAQRRNELQDAGLRIYEYTWDDVTRRSEHVRRTLRTRLRASVPSA